jgi:hypothetical protein
MGKFFTKNIGRSGRMARALWGVLLLAPGIAFALNGRPVLGTMLIVMGGFSLFEAARGWCILRACGIKTKY